jgi:hypothetical protein
MNQKPTKEQLVALLDQYIFGWAYKDIERASVKGEAKLAGFILGACFIDTLAGFYFGINRSMSKNNSGKRFTTFVKKYLKRYNAEKLWEDLRCGLVHSYAEGGTYVFTDANKAGYHFNKIKDGRILLNLEDFCADLREAYRLYRNDILINDKIYAKALRRLDMGIMALSKID